MDNRITIKKHKFITDRIIRGNILFFMIFVWNTKENNETIGIQTMNT